MDYLLKISQFSQLSFLTGMRLNMDTKAFVLYGRQEKKGLEAA